MLLLGISALLMAPLMMWRYGWRRGLRVLLPAALAVGATPALVALGGLPFTFFNAIALVLALSISIDYAIFCMEADLARQSTTMLGIWLATLTTILSFGLLALSSVNAVHAFGLTLAVGVTLSFLLSPMAGRGRSSGGGQNRDRGAPACGLVLLLFGLSAVRDRAGPERADRLSGARSAAISSRCRASWGATFRRAADHGALSRRSLASSRPISASRPRR